MKRVISVGQCGFDHGSISSLLKRQFGAEVVAADGLAGALRQAAAAETALVLVNRKLDADGSDGLEVIRELKSDSKTAAVPVMLVSNYPEYQAQAVALGAVSGFGKNDLSQSATIEKLRPYLGD